VGIRGEVSNSNFQPSKQSDVMIEAIRNWLPITARNRVALGFAVAALVMFVTWNCFPSYEYGSRIYKGLVITEIWIDIVDPDFYLHVFRAPDMDGFLAVAACMTLLLNGIVVLAIVPFWKVLHSSNYLRIPLAVANFAGGSVVFWLISKMETEYLDPYRDATNLLIVLTMFALSAALFIFKNELGIRHELEVKKMMAIKTSI